MAAKRKEATVMLRFKSDYAKSFFLGQLSDGWGENHVGLIWNRRVDLDRAKVVDVSVYSDWGDETHEIEDESTDRQHQRIKRLFRGEATPPEGDEHG